MAGGRPKDVDLSPDALARFNNEIIRHLASSATGRESMVEVAQHFMALAGGPRGMAMIMYQELLASKPGSMIRAKVLDVVLGSIKFAHKAEPPRDDFGLMTEEELEHETIRLLGRYTEANGPVAPQTS